MCIVYLQKTVCVLCASKMKLNIDEDWLANFCRSFITKNVCP